MATFTESKANLSFERHCKLYTELITSFILFTNMKPKADETVLGVKNLSKKLWAMLEGSASIGKVKRVNTDIL